jgi:nitronate monooxygenase
MALAGGGALAAAVTRAGGLGLIGGGYGDAAWLEEQFKIAGGERVGIGFITWSFAQASPSIVAETLAREPVAVMLSFGDPMVFASEIRAAGSVLICQCQDLGHVQDALDAGTEIVVAQGAEAGGHGSLRGTLPFVPEVADFLDRRAPETLLVAAGGIADGRGLAAALTLGADGVLVGTRLWAAEEALVHPQHHQAILGTNGDGTVRTRTADIARGLAWPPEFTARARQNDFTRRWQGHEDELAEEVEEMGPAYKDAWLNGDPDNVGVFFGEAAGLVNSIEPAARIIEQMVADAEECLARTVAFCS